MFTVILRHYRRLGLFAFGMAMMCLSMVANSGSPLSNIGNVIFFFMALLAFTFVALGLYSVRPGQRGILEIAGAASLLSTLVLFYLPLMGLVTSIIAIVVFTTTILALWLFLRSNLSRRIGARTTWCDRHSCDIPYPAKFVWNHSVPGALPAEDLCTGSVQEYVFDDRDEDMLEVIFKPRRVGQARYALTFLEKRAPSYCRFYFEGNEADGTLVDGVFSLAIEVVDKTSCTIITNEERSGMSLGALIERWFDDALGFQHDKLLALLDERYGNGEGVTKPMPPSRTKRRANIVSRVLRL